MSPDERAFLAGIAAHPDADLPRLVFADWLDENGQPERAEFIRLEIELAHGVVNPFIRRKLIARRDELFTPNEQVWRGPFPEGVKCEFRRGFIERCQCSASTAITLSDQWVAFTPLREMAVTELAELEAWNHQFYTLPALSHLSTLDLAQQQIVSSGWNLFCDRVDLAWLTTLVLNNNPLAPWDVGWMANAPFAKQLRELRLNGCSLGDATVATLLNSPSFESLQRLTLTGNSITPDILRVLMRSDTFWRLPRFELDCPDPYSPANNWTCQLQVELQNLLAARDSSHRAIPNSK